MSNSYKKTPICGWSCVSRGAQKKFKQHSNRAKRRKINQLCHSLNVDEVIWPHDKEYGNEWASPRDGKHYYGNHFEDLNRK